MSIRNLIILSQLNPPAQRNQVLKRERILKRLHNTLEYPVTVLKAGTGYGKSTAVISYIHSIRNDVYWYTTVGPDRDPSLFLAKLFTAFNQLGQEIGEDALRILDVPGSSQQEAMIVFINALSMKLKDDTLLVLDDYHCVYDVPEITQLMDWFIENIPPQLHIIIASRRTLKFPSMNKWKVKQSLQVISKEDLIFTSQEVHDLFSHHYGIVLKPDEIDQLMKKTEGWAIGLQMVWQSMQSNPSARMSQVLEGNQDSKRALFEYLAEEVLARQEPHVQDFLIKTSILSKLDSDTCDFLLNRTGSERILSNLHAMGLFIDELQPNIYRYHQIFQGFLLNRLQQDQSLTLELHRKIASYFSAHEYWERAISHLLIAGEYHRVNQILENIGEQMIQKGRYESISYWISTFPGTIRSKYPYISFLSGEVNRYTTKFTEALENYQAAEKIYRKTENKWGISISLRGQARVYLDTIRPSSADNLLQEAIEHLDAKESPEDMADLLTLKAENQLNLGFPENAEELLKQSMALNTMDTENDLIQARLYLRTGRLIEGVNLLERREASHPTSNSIARPQRFHREASLLLSLFYALKGEIHKAYHFAQRGIYIGEQLQSTFVQSVGYMRLGHALQLQSIAPWAKDGFNQAIDFYEESIEKVNVIRIHVEPLWGMCRALGYSGQIQEAEELAREALSIAQKAGDEWISALIRISLGAGEVLVKNYDKAHRYLSLAESAAKLVRDPFILCAAKIWQAINSWNKEKKDEALNYLQEALPIIKEHHYEFLLEKETIMGPNDREILKPLLITANENHIEEEMICNLLGGSSNEIPKYHPGYTLWIRTLDTFNVWRGDELIRCHEWKREKAKTLFQYIIANRGKWLHREQIADALWPNTVLSTALNNLKVTFNALNNALEPRRPRGVPSFFIERRQELYRINPQASVIVDVDLFEANAKEENPIFLQNAVDLYQQAYFNGSYVQEHLVVEEQYYHQKFLFAAEKLAQYYIDANNLQKALDVTYKMLSKEALCEPAYRLQIQIFHTMQHHAMVHSVYKQCKELFEVKNNIPLSPKIQEVYSSINSEQ